MNIIPLYLWMVLGKLDKGAVLKALCSGFEETTEPTICLSEGPYNSFPFQNFLFSNLTLQFCPVKKI